MTILVYKPGYQYKECLIVMRSDDKRVPEVLVNMSRYKRKLDYGYNAVRLNSTLSKTTSSTASANSIYSFVTL